MTQAFTGGPGSTLTPAPRIKILPPSAFGDTWNERPYGPTKVGLRCVSEQLTEHAVGLAVSRTRDIVVEKETPFERERWVEVYNSILMQSVLVHALCKPDDVTRPFFEHAPNDTITVALRPATVVALWEEYEQLVVDTSPLAPEAEPAQILEVAAKLAELACVDGTDPRARRIRRLVAILHAEL